RVGRGVVTGDYDNDGDVDVFIVNNGDKPMLLRNDGGNQNNWLKLRTIGTVSNRDGIGARVKVIAGTLTQIREVVSGGSYLSQSSLELEFGLGKATKVDQIIIQWPSGITQIVTDIEVNQMVVVTEPSK
ncbi:ASPIC/UnbV domain-containing protein, partial [Candidatus Poribacteria bacterium]|nr:ASPIC/UnbV domain-containing protein [Candidatus Poribacteria bacterium]